MASDTRDARLAVLIDADNASAKIAGRLFEEIKVELSRPRDRASEAFDAVKRQVMIALDRSLDRSRRPVDGWLTAGEGI